MFSTIDQSSVSYDYPSRFANGKESLATSPDAALLQKSMLQFVLKLLVERMTAFPNYRLLGESLFPMLVDVECFTAEAERAQLSDKLHAAFEGDPLEDGMAHPAERIIDEALQSREDQIVLQWLTAFSLDAAQPNFAASVLRCLGRQTRPGTGSWRAGLVRDALAMDDIEIRDAAVQAAEWWGERDIRDILKSHSDPVPWLRDYIRDVIDDLGE